jgi:hypothetical protein
MRKKSDKKCDDCGYKGHTLAECRKKARGEPSRGKKSPAHKSDMKPTQGPAAGSTPNVVKEQEEAQKCEAQPVCCA